MRCKKFILEWFTAYIGLVIVFEAAFRPTFHIENLSDVVITPLVILLWLFAITTTVLLGLPTMFIVGLMEEFGLVKSPPKR